MCNLVPAYTRPSPLVQNRSCCKTLEGAGTPNNYHKEHQSHRTVIELITLFYDTHILTHTPWSGLASYLIPTVLALFNCITLMNTGSVIKAFQAFRERAPRVKKARSFSALFVMFCKHLNVDCSKIESWISKFSAAHLIVFSGRKSVSGWPMRGKCNEQK